MSTPSLEDETRRLLDHGVSGLLIHQVSFPGPLELFELIHQVKSYAGRSLFVALDPEDGAGSRAIRGFTPLPSLAALGQTADLAYAREVGRTLGQELRAVGIDLCLGPILDVATNPKNPEIHARSLGSDPNRVAELGAQLIRGLQEEGVAACGKHFPGHGDTHTDSSEELPSLPHGVDRLEHIELKPFTQAIEARIAALLIGHLLFHSLDPNYPASLSRPILYGLLRQKLGYRGLVLSDDIDHGALTPQFSLEEIAERGLSAGLDCFLCAKNPSIALELTRALSSGIERGNILPERVEAARRRVGALQHRYTSQLPTLQLDRIGASELTGLPSALTDASPTLRAKDEN